MQFTRGKFNVHYITAPYSLLVKAFGDDGSLAGRDTDKVQAEWNIHGVEIYDYKSEVPKEQVTEWHVQGRDAAIEVVVKMLEAAETLSYKVEFEPEFHSREPESDSERVEWETLDTVISVLREGAVRLVLQEMRDATCGLMPADAEVFAKAEASGDPDMPKSYRELAPTAGLHVVAELVHGAFHDLHEQALKDAQEGADLE